MSTSRRQAAIGGETAKNPATKFLNWKSNDQQFAYYDKDKAENVEVKLPFKFLFLKQLQSVKGWSDALSGQIISNEVEFVGTQEINAVCYHKNIKGESTKTTIAKGLYSNIKDAVVSAGAKYHKSIYIMLEDGTLANIQLKGASVKEWGDFFNKSKSRLADEWVVVKSAKAGKKGAVKYFTPEFTFERSITEDEAMQADAAFDVLDAYLQAYLTKPVANIEVNEPVIVEEEDDCEF
jgi:membrane-bound inhibitor of C-type lysozyme